MPFAVDEDGVGERTAPRVGEEEGGSVDGLRPLDGAAGGFFVVADIVVCCGSW